MSPGGEGAGGARCSRNKLRVLGSGSILMPRGRSAAGYLLQAGEESCCLDFGPGSLLRLAEEGIAAERIRRVFLTHLHPDHHSELLNLLFLRCNPSLASRREPLVVHAAPAFAAILGHWQAAYGKWIADPSFSWEPLEPGDLELVFGHLVAQRTEHGASAMAFRFEFHDGGSLAYSGDSAYCSALVDLCRDASFALLECSYPDGVPCEGHLNPAGIRAILEEARPKRAGLTHFYPEMAELADDPLRFAKLWEGLSVVPIALADRMEIQL